MANNPMGDIRSLVERWCDRRQYNALAIILPAWTSNNGLTDGWSTLRDDLKHAYAMCTDLPDDERDELKGIYVARRSTTNIHSVTFCDNSYTSSTRALGDHEHDNDK